MKQKKLEDRGVQLRTLGVLLVMQGCEEKLVPQGEMKIPPGGRDWWRGGWVGVPEAAAAAAFGESMP